MRTRAQQLGDAQVQWADATLASGAAPILCERHHTKVHHGFTVVRDHDGRWHTYRPDGTEILIHALTI